MNDHKSNFEFILLVIPLGIITFTGFMLIYYHRIRSLKLQKKLKERFFHEVESEKIKISRELHDAIAPFTLPLKEFIVNDGTFNSENKNNWLQEVNKFETYLTQINENIFPAELLEGDLFEALQKLKTRLSTASTKIEIHSDIYDTITKSNSVQVYRIIQESLINAIKHSGTPLISVINSQTEKDLTCLITYEYFPENNEPDINKIHRRGQKIIKHRLELLSAKHDIKFTDNIKSEKFIFKDIFI